MPFRVTDSATSAQLAAQVATSRQRVASAQERIASGKRINRPSDDPAGAGAVLRLRTTQAATSQLQHNTESALNSQLVSDGELESYELVLDRARALLSQGASDSTTDSQRQTSAIEIDSLRTSALALANQRYGDQYIFGGIRQDVPPFDANGVEAATPTAPQSIQIDPDGEIMLVGVTADHVFKDAGGTVFDTLSAAAAAMRGTGDPVADRATILSALNHLGSLGDQARKARTEIGTGINRLQNASDQLQQRSLSLEDSAQRIEQADFVESAIQLTESQRTLEAILQTKAVTGRRSLIDFLG